MMRTLPLLLIKFLLVPLLFFISWSGAQAQLIVNNTGVNQSPNHLVQNVLLGNGITASNITFSGDSTTQLGFFDGSNSNIGLPSGIIMTTGDITVAPGPNTITNAGNNLFSGGDIDLDAIVNPIPTNDAAVLEFDFIPIGDSLIFRYVFASEEYQNFVCSNFNDVFGFFISGPGISGPFSSPVGFPNGSQNIALLPGTSTPVAINTVNAGSTNNFGGQPQPCTVPGTTTPCPCNAAFFVNNEFPNLGTSVQYDGFTVALEARAVVQCGEVYHIKMAVADVQDGILDSGVFLEAESFFSPGITVDVTTVSGDSTVVEDCVNASFTFSRPDSSTTQVVHFDIGGNAINGTDYTFIADSVVLAAGVGTVNLTIQPLADGIVEGVDTIAITVFNVTPCGDTIPQTAFLYILDEYSLNVNTVGATSNCPGDIVQISAAASGGTTPYNFNWSSGGSGSTVSVAPLTTQTYTVTVSDFRGCQGIGTALVNVNPPFTPDAGPNVFICSGSSVSIGGSPTGPVGSTVLWSPTTGLSNPTSPNPTASPTTTTTYTVTVTDINGCINTDQVTVTVGSSAPADAGPDVSGCQGDLLTIGGSPTGPAGSTYQWSPGLNLNNTTIANPTATVVGNTSYTVTVTDPSGCTGTDQVNITALPAPTVDILTTVNTICPGDSINIGTNNPAPPGTSYLWAPASSLNNQNLKNPQAGPLVLTTYFVTVTDANGCTNTDSILVNVGPEPVITLTANPSTTICPGDSVQLNATAVASNGIVIVPINSVTWTPASTLTNANIFDPVAFPSVTTTYVFTAVTIQGCDNSDSITVSVFPTVPADAGPDVQFCSGAGGGTIGGSPTGAPGSTYSWAPATGLSSTTVANPVANPTATTTYSVTVTDPNGCTSVDDVTVTINPLPFADAGLDMTICFGTGTVIGGAPSGPPGTTFSWSPTTGLSDPTLANPVASPTTTTVYTLTVTDANGCTATDDMTVNVNPSPPANAGPDVNICIGDTTQLSASGGITYQWSPTAGLSDPSIASPSAFPSSTTTYSVTVTDGNGCTAIDSVVVTVLSLPPVDAGPELWVCPGGSVQLNATGATTYLWSPAGTLNNPNIANPLATPAVNTVYTVLGTDGNGCQNTDSVLVVVNPIVPTDAGPDTSICFGEVVTLGGNPTSPNGTTYLWNPGGSLNDPTLANPVASPVATTQFIVETTNDTCSGSDTVNVTVLPLPPVDAGADIAICFGDTTQLNGAGAAVYNWTPTTGLSDPTIPNPLASPATTTEYFLTGIDVNGCENNDSVTVTVHPLPLADAGADQSICPGGTAQLQASGGVNFVWTPTIGLSNPNIANPLAFPTSTTTYTVLVTDTNGCENTDSLTITVLPAPTATALGDTTICLGDSAQLQASGGLTYLWSPGVSLSDPTSSSPMAGPSLTTTYTVTVTDGNGCTASDQVQVIVLPLPAIDAGANVEICLGDSTQLQATGGVSYLWSPATGLSATNVANPWASPTVTTTYIVIGTNSSSCSNFDSVTVTVHPLPVANAGPDQFICEAGQAFLNATGGQSYLWSPGTSLSDSTIANPLSTPQQTAAYTVIVTDSNGCTDLDTVVVNVFSVTGPQDTSICLGDTVRLNAIPEFGTDPYQFDWSPAAGLSDSTIGDPLASPQVVTQYEVLVSDANGCVDTANVTVSFLPQPTAVFEFELQPTCQGISATFDNLSTGADNYLWDFGDGTTSTEENPEHVFAYGQTMSVTLTAFNEFTCRSQDQNQEVIQLFDDYVSLEFPNVFSPNGDGINDFFEVDFGYDLHQCVRLEIFDRWGQRIFLSSGNYHNWDGATYTGRQVKEGVYFYVLEVNGLVFKGNITLLR